MSSTSFTFKIQICDIYLTIICPLYFTYNFDIYVPYSFFFVRVVVFSWFGEFVEFLWIGKPVCLKLLLFGKCTCWIPIIWKIFTLNFNNLVNILAEYQWFGKSLVEFLWFWTCLVELTLFGNHTTWISMIWKMYLLNLNDFGTKTCWISSMIWKTNLLKFVIWKTYIWISIISTKLIFLWFLQQETWVPSKGTKPSNEIWN